MSSPRVVLVAPGSPAAVAGLEPGDELITLNGEAPRDVIRYRMLTDEPQVEIEVRRGGIEHTVFVEKAAGAPLGVEVHSAVFDRVQTCDNHCPFCFIYQLPPGMRKSLYLKDDDYRLSFLYGNFTTLTRFTEADLERVIDEGLGPLYVSIHATDPDVRAALLRNRRGATSLRWLRLLLDAGVEVHGQVVVCPGINDGDVLDDTLLGVLDRFAELASVGVVPLGVSAFNREESMRPHAPGEPEAVVDCVTRWQARFLDALGRRMVYASDEYYLMAARPFPAYDEYDDFVQHENGIGMARLFEREVQAAARGELVVGAGPRSGFFAAVDGAPADGYRAPREVAVSLRPSRLRDARQPVTLVTGEFGSRVLAPLLGDLAAVAGVDVDVLPVANRYFGGTTAVTGLLTGSDVADALRHQAGGDRRYLLPDVVLSRGVFLDGTSVNDLPVPVEVVRTDGAALVDALRAA
jgi:putative radical SAM enzyme (TIGR03279 family)